MSCAEEGFVHCEKNVHVPRLNFEIFNKRLLTSENVKIAPNITFHDSYPTVTNLQTNVSYAYIVSFSSFGKVSVKEGVASVCKLQNSDSKTTKPPSSLLSVNFVLATALSESCSKPELGTLLLFHRLSLISRSFESFKKQE